MEPEKESKNICGHCGHFDPEGKCKQKGIQTGYFADLQCPYFKVAAATTKKCAKCGRDLPLDAFALHNRSMDGHRNICKECHSGSGEIIPPQRPIIQAFTTASHPGREACTVHRYRVARGTEQARLPWMSHLAEMRRNIAA